MNLMEFHNLCDREATDGWDVTELYLDDSSYQKLYDDIVITGSDWLFNPRTGSSVSVHFVRDKAVSIRITPETHEVYL
jgi:hypothetical protein